MWLCSGDTSASNNFLAFLKNTLAKLQNKTVGLIRLDSGFCKSAIFDYLETKQIDYVVAARFTHHIQRLIANADCWNRLDDGIEICERYYKADGWKQARRIVIVRQKIAERPHATGRQLKLFMEDETYRSYRYSAYVTTLKFSASDVWRLYRGRAEAENRIKKLKYDFGFDSFNLNNFCATEAALTFAMLAYNLMSLFRIFVMQEKTQKTLSTLRYRTFEMGAYFVKLKGRLVLKIAIPRKRRLWFDGLWNYSKDFNFPFEKSIA